MSERSHWGWGHADKHPGAEARQALGGQLLEVLGMEGSPPANEPSLAEVSVPPSAITLPSAVRCASDDREARVRHTYGRGFRDQVRGFHGDFQCAPDVVATPTDEAEIEAVLAWAERGGLVVVPFGGGTSVVAGVEAPLDRRNGVVSLDLGKLNQVLEVDAVSGLARIQAGTLGPDLEAQLKVHGLTLRHFPQSFEFSTLGGWLATRAGGHFATVYTHIDDLTASIRMIAPAGQWESRCLPGSGAGPSPDRLILGSEGTLGVITEAWMRVRARPRWRASASVEFDRFDDAVAAARALAQSGLFPSNCRLLDAEEARLNFVAPRNVLLIAFESADHGLEAWMGRATQIALSCGGEMTRPATYRDTAESGRDRTAGSWRDAFLSGPYMQSTLIALGLVVDTFETACTWRQFPALHGALHDAVRDAMQRVCGGGRLTCRFTHVYPDGPAPYYTFIAPGRLGGQLEQWAEIKQAASDALIANGATITHHHAVGRTHRPWYEKQSPALMGEVLRAAKSKLDPAGIMNPGVLFDRFPSHRL